MLWIIAAGSAIGGALRYLAGTLIQRMIGGTFPSGTLVVNITGSFAIGVLMRWSLDASHSAELRAFLTVGLCGGYTTFSAFSYETLALAQDGAYGRAAGYAIGSVVLALLATLAGLALANAVAGPSRA